MQNLDMFDNEQQQDSSNGQRSSFFGENGAMLASEGTKLHANTQELMSLVLSKVDTITNQTLHLSEAIKSISQTDWSDTDECTVEKVIDGLTTVIREREETNRESIRLFEKIINNMKIGEHGINRLDALGIDWNETLERMAPREKISFLRELMSL